MSTFKNYTSRKSDVGSTTAGSGKKSLSRQPDAPTPVGSNETLPPPPPPSSSSLTPTSKSSSYDSFTSNLRPNILNRMGVLDGHRDKKSTEALAAKKNAMTAIKQLPSKPQQILKHVAITLAPKDREALLRKWGDKVYKIEEEACHLFSSLEHHQTDGHLKADEFAKCLGAMGMITSSFPQVLFSSIDTDNSGSISFYEFISWLLVMSYGTDEEKLHYGFNVCDQNHDGKIDKADLTTTIENMFKVLTGLHVEGAEMDVTRFVDMIFEKLGQKESGEISWQVFQSGVKSIETFLRTLGSRKASCYRSVSTKKGGTLVFGGEKWRFILNMMLGLEYAVRGINQLSEDDIKEEEAVRESDTGSTASMEGISYQVDLSTKTVTKEYFDIPTNDGSKCRIVAYGAAQFNAIRQACGISDDDFLLSVGIRQVIGSLLVGDLFGLSEQVSEGRSGSMFYWSNDGRYMIKSISRAESYTMRKILSSYKQHMMQFPENLLMRILGLYRLKINSDKWDIIVISNVFESSLGIHERFDLKGSTYERTVGPRKRCMPGVVMKDKDFLEMGRKMRVGPELSQRLKTQLKIDSQFLAKHDIIDYSLLLGVHYADRGVPEDVWMAKNSSELEKMYVKFQQEIQGEFFNKDFDFERFSHYAYLHQHFETKQSQPATVGGAGGASSGGASMPRESSETYLPGAVATAQGNPSNPPQQRISMNLRKGITAHKSQENADEPDQVIFMGIIDILVPFDTYKKSEYVFKSLLHAGGQTFSVIPPRDYAERFHAFMINAIR